VNDAGYIGWIRVPGQLWHAVVSAPTEDAAWHLLRLHIDQLGAKVIDSFVGPASVDPRGRRRRGDVQGRLFL
jgi:hypothetical protein